MRWLEFIPGLRPLPFIYLITGANGTGKTAFTLKEIREKQLAENRPVYWNGRFDLTEEKQKEFGWVKIEAKDWQDAPDGTIFLFDECHNDFPTRPTNSAVPRYVSAFGEHRKRGFDFFMLTQHPGNIDPFIRKIIATPGWHRHLKRNFGTSLVSHLDFPAVVDRPEKPGAGKTGTVTMKALPKEVYDWYKSAELHTAKRRIPRQVWVLVACVVVVPLLAWYAIHNLRHNAGMDRAKGADPVLTGVLAAGGPPVSSSGHVSTALEYVASYTPRIAGLMHTAPAYDKLTEPRRVPVPAACIESKQFGCKCYTQDATPYPVDHAMCEQLVQHGAFLAFRPEGEVRAQPVVQPAPDQGRAGARIDVPAPSGMTVMGDVPGESVAPSVPVSAEPQRIATVAANAKH